MKKSIILLLAIASMCWSIPKPMESIENYNVMMVHGAADSLSGVDCEASDLKAPFEF